jgi:hypothetical protein
MFQSVVAFLFLNALIFLVWAIVRATKSGNPVRANDRVFIVKTSWVMLFASILWFAMAFVQVYAFCTGLINLVSWFDAFGWFFIAAVYLAWKTHVFNEMARKLKK